MAITWYDLIDGANGSPVVATDYTPDMTTVLNSGGTAIIQTSGGTFGAIKHLLETASVTNGGVYRTLDFTGTDVLAASKEIVLKALPSAECGILAFAAGTTRSLYVAITTTGALRVRDGAGAAKWTVSPSATSSPVMMALDTAYVLAIFGSRNAATGTYRVVLFNKATGAILIDSGLQTAQNTGAAAWNRIYEGVKAGAGTQTLSIESASLGVDPAATDVIPPRETRIATPVVTLGSKTNPTAPGVDDGTQTVTWPDVSGESSYEAWIAEGATPDQADFTLVDTGVTSPYTFTDLADGTYAYGIKAKV